MLITKVTMNIFHAITQQNNKLNVKKSNRKQKNKLFKKEKTILILNKSAYGLLLQKNLHKEHSKNKIKPSMPNYDLFLLTKLFYI